MMNANSAVIVSADARTSFRDQVGSALSNQAVEIDDTTTVYLVNLLTAFTHARELFEDTDDGLQIKPLAMHYADAISAPRVAEKSAALRKLVDIDYYIAMGGTAYSCVHDISTTHKMSREQTGMFAELAEKFSALVEALNEIGEGSNLHSNSDLLRIYEIWLKTGSDRAYDKLQRLSLNPSLKSTSLTTH